MEEFRLPEVTYGTPAEQIEQLRRYLIKTVRQLNAVLRNLPTQGSGNKTEINADDFTQTVLDMVTGSEKIKKDFIVSITESEKVLEHIEVTALEKVKTDSTVEKYIGDTAEQKVMSDEDIAQYIKQITEEFFEKNGLKARMKATEVTSDICEFAKNCENGLTSIITSGADAAVLNVPEGYTYSPGLILKRFENVATIILAKRTTGDIVTNTWWKNSNGAEQWSGWKGPEALIELVKNDATVKSHIESLAVEKVKSDSGVKSYIEDTAVVKVKADSTVKKHIQDVSKESIESSGLNSSVLPIKTVTGSIITFAKNCKNGITVFQTTPCSKNTDGTYNGDGTTYLPKNSTANYDYKRGYTDTVGFVLKLSEKNFRIYVPHRAQYTIAVYCYYENSTNKWGGEWKYLNLDANETLIEIKT